MNSKMLETDPQCVILPRNFCILTGDTTLTQRNETLKMLIPWVVTSQQERGFGVRGLTRALWGSLNRYHGAGVTAWSSVRFLFVVNMNLRPCCIVSVMKIVTAETV